MCGGRDFFDEILFRKTLAEYRDEVTKIICGYDPEREYPTGADKLAYEYAIHWKIPVETYPYHYHLKKAGGSSRNQQMLDEGFPDFVLAFPTAKSRGTWDMVRRSEKAGIEVRIIK